MKRGALRSVSGGGSAFGSYKVCLFTGIYLGIAASAWAAKVHGIAPGAMALATLACAAAALVGARIFHLAIFTAHYRAQGFRGLWNSSAGGGSLFGGLLAVAVVAPVCAALLRVPLAGFWDLLMPALLVGAVCTRFGCYCHGCCGGRVRRVPVQLLEIAWVLVGLAAVVWFLRLPHRAGSPALGGLAWYGVGRFLLEPFRDAPDLVWGNVRINQVIAALIALVAGGWLVLR
jgi:phosphatidylglycerol:prolipoprotein diacylglycerol transferase